MAPYFLRIFKVIIKIPRCPILQALTIPNASREIILFYLIFDNLTKNVIIDTL